METMRLRIACDPQIGKMMTRSGPRSAVRWPLLTVRWHQRQTIPHMKDTAVHAAIPYQLFVECLQGGCCQPLIVCSSSAGYEGSGMGCVPRSWFTGSRRAVILRPGQHYLPHCDQPLVFDLSNSNIHQPSPLDTLQECASKCVAVICEPFQFLIWAMKSSFASLAAGVHCLLMSIHRAILNFFKGDETNASETLHAQQETKTEATTTMHAVHALPRHVMVQGQARHCAQASVTLFQQTYWYTELSSWGAARKVGVLALLLAAIIVPNCVRALWLEAERVREEQELLEQNALSLRLQRKRFEAALLASTNMKAAAEALEAGERSTPGSPQTKQASQIATPKQGAWLDDTSQEEWRKFMSGSKAAHVHQVWDMTSRSDSSKTGAPQASKAELEEITRRVRNANKNADGTDKKAVTFDDLYGCGNEILEIRPKGSRRLQQSSNEPPKKTSDETPPATIGAMNAVKPPAEESMAERAARRRARLAQQFANDDEVEAMLGLKPHLPKKRAPESTSAPANNIIPLGQQCSARKDKTDARAASVPSRRTASPPPVHTHGPETGNRNGTADAQGARRLHREILQAAAAATDMRGHHPVPRTAHQPTQVATPKPVRAGSPILTDSCILPPPPSPVTSAIHDDDGQASTFSPRQQPRAIPPPCLNNNNNSNNNNLSDEPSSLVYEASVPSVKHSSNGIGSERSDCYANGVERVTNKLSQPQSEQCNNGHQTSSHVLQSNSVQVLSTSKSVHGQDNTSHHFQDTAVAVQQLNSAPVMTLQQQQTAEASHEQLQYNTDQDEDMDVLSEYFAAQRLNQHTNTTSQALQAYETEPASQHFSKSREHSHPPDSGLVLPDSTDADGVQMLQRFMRRPGKGVSLANVMTVAVAGVGCGLLFLAQHV